MKRFILVLMAIAVLVELSYAGTNPADIAKKRSRDFELSKASVLYAKRVSQGFNMQVWISNQMCMGLQAWDGTIPNTVEPGFGLEYPVGSGVEHVFGAGPWIGGKVNGVRKVSEGYNGNSADKNFLPNPQRPLRELMWFTSTRSTIINEPNKRGCDDDNDGAIDEDDLDGLDNDGDWVLALHDVGSDGLPDSLESGCKGGYNALTNPDPAFDNYEPAKTDECHPDANGNFRRKSDRDAYTEKNSLTDHGEPNVDEDYAAISESDYYCSATDTVPQAGHFPMGIKVIQKSYAWSGDFAEGVLPFDYYFIPERTDTIKDVYVAFFADLDVGPINVGNYFNHCYSAYFDSLRTAFIHNPIDRGSTPLGITVLNTPKPLDQLNYIFQWFDFSTNQIPDQTDSTLYSWISGEANPDPLIAPSQSPTATSDTRFFFSFGPFESLTKGDTLKISLALVGGEGVESGPNNLKSNAEKAIKLFKRGYIAPVVPPSPRLRLTEGFRKITIDWSAQPGDIDPMEVWDDSNKIAQSFPDTHYRRRDPPCEVSTVGCGSGHVCNDVGYLPGGRIFEGYRLYRSEDPNDQPSTQSFTLLKQFDLADDDFEYNVGLETSFTDSNLVRGKRYWYSVTSFGIPDVSVVEIPTEGGGVIYDSLYTDSPESSIRENLVRVDLAFSASNKVGEVLVVPNPYRIDQDYTYENGGWEGLGRSWSEEERLVRFIHLPRKCLIRIFTLAGDQITTLSYEAPPDKPDAGELSWNLLSESRRALASGVYVFTVESDLGTQVGKFVLIR